MEQTNMNALVMNEGAEPECEHEAPESEDGEGCVPGQDTDERNASDAEPDEKDRPAADEPEDAGDSHEGPVEEAPRQSRAQARIRSLIEKNKALAQELKAMHEGRDAAGERADAPSQEGDTGMHPALVGAKFDERGNVLYQGVPVTREFAIRQYEMANELRDLKGMLAAQDERQREAEHTARVEQAQRELVEAVAAEVQDRRAEAFPHLDKRQASAVDRQLFVLVDSYVTNAVNDGCEYSPELIGDATQRALDDLRETFGIFGARQMEDNRQHAETYRIKPTGMPGVPVPKPLQKMSKAEREAFADQAARAAEAMRGG